MDRKTMLTYEQSNAISQLRVLAMLSIVSCHILQGFGNRWAWILNVGVQVFFVISGYLYGTKEISNWKMWFVKRVEKIYIPFILFVFVMLTLYACFSDISIKFSFVIKYLLNIQGIIGGVNGLGHLWFITAIFLCYLVVPILQRLKKWSDWILLFLLFVGILQYVFIHFYLIYFSWFFLFSSGYFYAAASDRGKRWFRIGMLIGLIMVCMIIGWKDIIDYDSWLNGLFHALLGFVIVAYGGLSLVWLKMENL